MTAGPVSESPSRLQRRFFAMSPRWSSVWFGLTFGALYTVMLAVTAPAVFITLIWIPLVGGLGCGVAWHLVRDDRTWSQEERLAQHMPYWPRVERPKLRTPRHFVYAIVLAALLVWAIVRTSQRIVEDGSSFAAVGLLLLSISGFISIAGITWRSLRARD
jgi:hypothetical protein